MCGECQCPPQVSFDDCTRALAAVPERAFSFAYCYGATNFGSYCKEFRCGKDGMAGKNNASGFSFLLNGGFIYFDVHNKIVGVTCIRTSKTRSMLHFGPYTGLTDAQSRTMSLSLENRFQEVSLEFMVRSYFIM